MKRTQKTVSLKDFNGMKKIFLFTVSFLFLENYGFSQQMHKAIIDLPKGDKLIFWETPETFDMPGIGSKKFLKFNYAQYDIQNHLLPIYAEKISVPEGIMDAEIKIENVMYEPLSEEEKSAMNSYDQNQKSGIGNDISIKKNIACHKKKTFLQIEFVPIRKNPTSGNFEKLVSFSLSVSPEISVAIQSQINPQKISAANSVLAAGNWYKVGVLYDGIHRMDYNFLKNLGIDPEVISPQDIKVYGNGGGQLPYANSSFRYDDLQENSIFVSGEGDGKFDSTDYVLFFGQSQHRWTYNTTDQQFHHNLNIYSDTTYYFITTDLGPGKRILSQGSSTLSPNHVVTTYNGYLFHELETYNLIRSGRIWMGEEFDILTSYSYNISVPNIDLSSKVYIQVETGARANSPGTSFYWTAGSASSSFNVIGVVTSNIYDIYYRTYSDTVLFYPSSGIIPLTISKTTPSPAIGWLNYYEVNARRQLTGEPMLLFRDINCVNTGNVSRFIISNAAALQVWEVTDPLNPKLQQTTLNGTALEFILPTDSLREFAAFSESTLTPIISGNIPNQNLHGSGPVDFIIVTHPLFLTQANALADLHRNRDSMKVLVATTHQVFNEFSSGAQDVSAIRDFTRMFYERAQDSTEFPQYLLLFGDGSYNMKSTINNTNFVPCYQSLNSSSPINSYVSDDYFTMLDSNEGYWDVTPGYMDLGVGRLPVKSISEADLVVQKIIRYTSVPGTISADNSCSNEGTCHGFGDWMNVLTFCADDEDGGLHHRDADILANTIKVNYPTYNIDKIYFDSYQQISTPGGQRYPDAKADFNRRMNRGGLIVNWTGHGGPKGWAHERFLEIYDINSWTNQCRLPFFFTATCDFSLWDDPSFTSGGELALLNPNGGAIGLMSTTRVVYSGPNAVLNKYFYDYTFNLMPNGKMPRMGDLVMLTKNSMSPVSINHRGFSLLGDPALTLSYPKHSIATTEINGTPVVAASPDTLHALSLMTVRGEVRDESGNILPNFNGIIYPTVFDKATTIKTLSNDGSESPSFTFNLQKNILFKGKASVTNGFFSFSFIVPKDIAYNYARAKISYYSHNGYEDANGYSDDFVIGGTDSTAIADVTGPQIKLFMNDEKFVFGGTTDDHPKIYIVVSDSIDSNNQGSGINTAGTGIGHDLTAVLDNNETNPFVLNDYYESDMNSYKKGTVRYPLSDLSDGAHHLLVKVWDVHNNSTTTYTEFVVASSAQLALKHVLNYPNPFTTKTSFYFEHNQSCTNIDVQVQIFTVSGKLVKTIQQFVNMEGFRSDPIEWNGTDDYGDPIGRGVYVYRLRAKTSAGESAEQLEKLVILK